MPSQSSQTGSVLNLWRCPECAWVGYSVDGHCRQFDEHLPEGPRIPLQAVEYVPKEDYDIARWDANVVLTERDMAIQSATLVLAQALRLIRDTGSDTASRIAGRALEQAGIEDPEDDHPW